ncbi:glycosyltransferase family A protein [Lacinutrix neustonica]|uniref:Glycosyltransferase family A protein n=1 Tax=Lacinutrix neustonica TaxID=2980107 RepID=A0A9E8MYI7_9FLAO|nr:glycosyltransferase family A protein [Lacinutrix neustonica]WAC03923.1 glycosyltransferase family A protein [Lacinutrix neustonica]
MFIVLHKEGVVTSILDEAFQATSNFETGESVPITLKTIANKNRKTLLVRCHERLKEHLNIEAFETIFHHDRIFAAYNPTVTDYLPKQIGYVERSFFLKVNKKVSYPTWLMSNHIGGISTEVFLHLGQHLNVNESFDYFLLSLAKRGMGEGLFCYSEPALLNAKPIPVLPSPQASKRELFKFVRQHYKWVWVLFLAWSYSIFERQLSVYSVVRSLFYKRLKTNFELEAIPMTSTKKQVEERSIDVVIPTIGRKTYLYNVLQDLAKQTHLPKNVIIVEQNPNLQAVSELDYIHTVDWPFTIKHTFTHQPGVCNARNIALSQIESEWTFSADDDIRFENDFFDQSFKEIKTGGLAVLNYLCLQPGQEQTYFKSHQTTIFSSGSSMVKSEALKDLTFNTAYEFGFGEDSDFGMQLRQRGYDVVFIPHLKITHLKAPIGGYRTKIEQRWENDEIQPKPSPTIQLLYRTYFTKQQLLGYKLLLFLKLLKANGFKNPVAFKRRFKNQWHQSVLWSLKLKQQ